MQAENFVFKGKFFVYSKELNKIKDVLTDFLQTENYQQISPISFFYNFFSLTFMRYTSQLSVPLNLRIKKYLGLISQNELAQELYFKSILRTRNDIPYEINVFTYLGKLRDTEGILIEVLSKPVVYYKITQLSLSPNSINKEEYSFISVENKTFIEKIAKALHGIIVDDPKPLNLYIETEIIEKLKSFDFGNVAEIMKKGKEKIELGNSDGLDDLRGVIENFLSDLISKLGGKPYPLHECEKNIQQLKKLGYIDENIERLIQFVLHKGVYVFLSNVKTHPRKDVDLFTSRLCFDLTENVIDNLIERTVRFKTKVSKEGR